MSNPNCPVSVRNLSKYYGDLPAVRDLTFSLSQDDVLGVVGPPGSGKSTLLRILAGRLTYSAGEVTILGFDPMLAEYEIRRRVGLFPESLGSFEHMRIEEGSTSDALKSDFECEQTIGDIEKEWGLQELFGRKILDLSNFARRRAILWDIWRQNPPLVLVDEPLKGLAGGERTAFIRLLQAACRGRSAVISSENIVDVWKLASRIMMVSEGKLVLMLPTGQRDRPALSAPENAERPELNASNA